MGGMIHISQGATRLNKGRTFLCVYKYPFHGRKINYKSAIAGSKSGSVVPSAPYSNMQLLFTCKMNSSNNIRHIVTPGNQYRAFVEHAIVYLAGSFIILICRL